MSDIIKNDKKNDARSELLEEYDNEQKREKNLDFKFLLLIYMVMAVAFLIVLPKIYIKNQVYYISRDINQLYSEYAILNEENKYLKQKLESIRFKNRVLDSIFIELEE